jgi:hypothetical protein
MYETRFFGFRDIPVGLCAVCVCCWVIVGGQSGTPSVLIRATVLRSRPVDDGP